MCWFPWCWFPWVSSRAKPASPAVWSSEDRDRLRFRTVDARKVLTEVTVVLKKIFGKKKPKIQPDEGKELTIEDLITLERYEEAVEMLKQRLKLVPKDLHAHLKLAEVYVSLRNVPKALDEFMFVADSYADDGFHDKGIALLSKASRLVPGDDSLPRRIEKYKTQKKLEGRRKYAVQGLLNNKTTGIHTAGNSKVQLELLWNKIARSHIVHALDGDNIQKLFSVMTMVQTKRDQVLADAGSSLPVLFLVVAGVVQAEADIGGRNMDLRSFSTGDVIGESALLERKAWPARYKVIEQGTLFRLDREGLELAMAGNPDPVGFLGVLRQQHNDRDVLASLQRLRAS